MKARLLIIGLHLTLRFLMPLVPEQSHAPLMENGRRLVKGLTLGRGISEQQEKDTRRTLTPSQSDAIRKLRSRHAGLAGAS